MNVKLLQEVARQILASPAQLNMSMWFVVTDPCGDRLEHGSASIARNPALSPVSNCQTTACIAGWTCALRPELVQGPDAASAAQRLLGLDMSQSQRLFYKGSWPNRFVVNYDTSPSPAARARVTAERIEHFIATGGAE